MNTKGLLRRRNTGGWSVVLLAAALLTSSATQAQTGAPSHRDSMEAAKAFRVTIERFLEKLPLEREKFEVRANRCQTSDGSMRDDIYTIWIGARLIATDDNADVILEEIRAQWQHDGWPLTRDRRLDNGGVNIAAIEPDAGNSYSLDSGLSAGPRRYVVSYFNTPCYVDPSGAVSFGSLRQSD